MVYFLSLVGNSTLLVNRGGAQRFLFVKVLVILVLSLCLSCKSCDSIVFVSASGVCFLSMCTIR